MNLVCCLVACSPTIGPRRLEPVGQALVRLGQPRLGSVYHRLHLRRGGVELDLSIVGCVTHAEVRTATRYCPPSVLGFWDKYPTVRARKLILPLHREW